MNFIELRAELKALKDETQNELLNAVIEDVLSYNLSTIDEVLQSLSKIDIYGVNGVVPRFDYEDKVRELFHTYTASILEIAIDMDEDLKEYDDLEQFIYVSPRIGYEAEAHKLKRYIKYELLAEPAGA